MGILKQKKTKKTRKIHITLIFHVINAIFTNLHPFTPVSYLQTQLKSYHTCSRTSHLYKKKQQISKIQNSVISTKIKT